MVDASGKCVPTYEKVQCGENTEKDGDKCVAQTVECGQGTTKKDGQCVDKGFRITKIESEGEVVVGGSGLRQMIHWEGSPSWPLKLYDYVADDCVEDVTCSVTDEPVEITQEQNPLVFEDTYRCTGPAAGKTFTRAIYLEDDEGTETNTVLFEYTCQSG
jgi:hypothetical protein